MAVCDGMIGTLLKHMLFTLYDANILTKKVEIGFNLILPVVIIADLIAAGVQ